MRSTIRFGAAVVALLVSLTGALQARERTILSFEERVDAQRAIEEVFWRHRIWPVQNPQPKPALDQVMTESEIKGKVEDYLEKSLTLDVYGKYPITANQLQAEVERMRRETRQPEVLAELFAALGDDPLLISECLARPALANRLASADLQMQIEKTAASSGAEARGAMQEPPLSFEAGGSLDVVNWSAVNQIGAPAARQQHTAVWTGVEMIVWGGVDASGNTLGTGGRYTPSTNIWSPMSNFLSARAAHTAVWTGTRMIVWGGDNGSANLNDGGLYNPLNNSWAPMSTGPSARRSHVAVWANGVMIVWGGFGVTYLKTGGRYDPVSDSWTPTNSADAPSVREHPTAVWTQNEMIIWGGNTGFSIFNTGGRYNPNLNTWTPTSTGANVPTPRSGHSAVWTDSEMIVWGGADAGGLVNSGGRYAPNTDTWTQTSTDASVPSGRKDHTAIWTGNGMIVWGGIGLGGGGYRDTGGNYNAATDSWTETSLDSAPAPRTYHTAVWTGAEMIVWGGGDSAAVFNSGGRYTPCTATVWYRDADGDGYGNPGVMVLDCAHPTGYVEGAGDCDDSSSAIHPGATELCDNLDNNCDGTVDNAVAPTGAPALGVSEPAYGTARLTWAIVPTATAYDVVQGNLLSLASSGGNYTVSTEACLGDNVPAAPVDDSSSVSPGAGVWYLVRAVNCGGAGTYDSGSPAQVGSRDVEIQASASHCP